MAAIGSLVFCTACGDLLDASSGDERAILKCNVCGTENKGTYHNLRKEVKVLIDVMIRYIGHHNYDKIEAHSIPLSSPLKAISSADLDRRRHPERCRD